MKRGAFSVVFVVAMLASTAPALGETVTFAVLLAVVSQKGESQTQPARFCTALELACGAKALTTKYLQAETGKEARRVHLVRLGAQSFAIFVRTTPSDHGTADIYVTDGLGNLARGYHVASDEPHRLPAQTAARGLQGEEAFWTTYVARER